MSRVQCPKCLARDPQTRYVRPRTFTERGNFAKGEHLHLTCRACTYSWEEATADSGGSPPPPPRADATNSARPPLTPTPLPFLYRISLDRSLPEGTVVVVGEDRHSVVVRFPG